MKIVDEKGRIFGKLNIIDFIVILILLSFVPMIYFGYKVFTKKEEVITTEKWIVIYGKFSELLPEVSSRISRLDTMKAPSGKVIGKIGEVRSAKPSDLLVLTENREVTVVKHPSRKDMLLWLDILVLVKNNDTMYYNNSPVKIGEPIIFSTDEYTINGIIVDIVK